MSQLQKLFTKETGINPIIMNQVGYGYKYVDWLEAKVENFDSTKDSIKDQQNAVKNDN
jgi:hypothetical protein